MRLIDILHNSFKCQNHITKPYIIAEAGVNHEGSMDVARKLIEEAAEGGAHAIKFQTYKAEKLAIRNSPSYWDKNQEPTPSQYKLFKKYDSFWKSEYEGLKKCCEKADIEFLSTPFDLDSAQFLNSLVDVFKIASSDITNLPFIDAISKFNKPILLSTGASYISEISDAVNVITKYNIPYCLLHCVLNYPTSAHHANLGMLLDIKHHFPDAILGYSDHTLPENMDVLIIANLLGATIIEKHFTHDKKLKGNDHYHSMDKIDLKKFRKRLDQYYDIIGSFYKNPLASEESSRKYARRSLVTTKDLSVGHTLEVDDVTWKRPGTGISPKYLYEIIGKKSTISIQKDEVISWNMVI